MGLRLAQNGIVDDSVVDGPGLRLVVFTQGCPHHCPGCHNPHTHPFEGGVETDPRDVARRFAENPLLAGITFSGGEPFAQAEALCEVARFVRDLGKNVVTYTGFTFEELLEPVRVPQDGAAVAELLRLTDLLIDGPFIASERDLTLLYRGSRNQRMLTRAQRAAIKLRERPRAETSAPSWSALPCAPVCPQGGAARP